MRIITTFINLFILAGALLLMFLIVMAGSTDTHPLNKFYWLKADTSDIPGAYSESSWSFWGVCDHNNFHDCKLGPAYPISPVDNFDTTSNVPSDFVDNRDNFYYLSRFGFSFLIIALFFGVFAFIIYVLGFCFAFIDAVFMGFVTITLVFFAGFASVMTACAVLARNAFSSDDKDASLGVKLLAMTWACFTCLLIVFFCSCYANIANSYNKYMSTVRAAQQPQYPAGMPDAAAEESSFTRTTPAPETKQESNGGIRFFKIKRNNQKVSDDESL